MGGAGDCLWVCSGMLCNVNSELLRSAMASRPPLQLQFSVQGGKRGRNLVVSVCVDGTI